MLISNLIFEYTQVSAHTNVNTVENVSLKQAI